MKPQFRLSVFVLPSLLGLCLGLASAARAATILWTNTAGGNWTTAANWSPNQVPGSSDTAIITNGGDYTVTLDSGATLAGLALGASSGSSTQTLAWTGGILRCGNLAIARQGLLSLSGDADKKLGPTMLDNAGTVRWAGGRLIGYFDDYYQTTRITNQPSGVFDIQSDTNFFYSAEAWAWGKYQTFVFENAGTLCKSAGTGATVFDGSSGYGPFFRNWGSVELQQGRLQFTRGFTNNGAFNLATNTGVDLRGGTFWFEPTGQKTGSGEILVSTGEVTLKGTLQSLTWSGGRLVNSDITVATNGVMTLTGDTNKVLNTSTLRVAGTLNWTGTGHLVAYFNDYYQTVRIETLPGSVFDIQNDANLFLSAEPYGRYPTFAFENGGLLRKSANTGTTTFSGLTFRNTGTVVAQQGTLALPYTDNQGTINVQQSLVFQAGLTNNGVLNLATNVLINLSGGAFTFGPASQVLGDGQLAIPSGDITLNGTVGNLLWTGGRLVNSTLTIASNGVLTLGGAADKTLFKSTLNNAGTIRWTDAGRWVGYFNDYYQLVLITNLPGALIEIQNDANLAGNAEPNANYATLVLHNAGTLRKSGGTGTNSLNTGFDSVAGSNAFVSEGTVEVLVGTLNVGSEHTRISGTLNFGLTSPSGFGKLTVPSQASLRGIIRAMLINPTGLSAGDQFPVLNQGSSLAGAVVFAGRNLGDALVYDPVLSASALTLVLRAATHPTPPVISLSYAPQLPAFVLMEGVVGPSYRFQASTDLTTWTALETNAAPAGIWEFSDPNAPTSDDRFYRGVAQ